jgi:hypothetical protein
VYYSGYQKKQSLTFVKAQCRYGCQKVESASEGGRGRRFGTAHYCALAWAPNGVSCLAAQMQSSKQQGPWAVHVTT